MTQPIGAVPPARSQAKYQVRFDWSEPGTWEPAVAGASRMYLMTPHEMPIDPSFIRCAVEQKLIALALAATHGEAGRSAVVEGTCESRVRTRRNTEG